MKRVFTLDHQEVLEAILEHVMRKLGMTRIRGDVLLQVEDRLFRPLLVKATVEIEKERTVTNDQTSNHRSGSE